MKVELDGPLEWFVLVVMLGFFVVAPLYLRRHWRGGTAASDAWNSGLWYRSPALRRGHRRAAVPLMLVGVAIFGFGLTLFVIPPVPEGEVDLPASVALVVAAAIVLVATVLYWLIVLFNVPKWLVAPHQRGEPGALAERRDRRGAQR